MLDEHDPACAVSHLCRQLERELTAAQAEIARLKAGGCARDQRTTQFCAEALALNDEIERLRFALSKQNQDIEQTCGKALGYPWFKDDQKNFPGSTEEHGVCVGEHVAETIAAELADAYKAAKEENAKLQERVKRLVTLGNRMSDSYECVAQYEEEDRFIKNWRKAAEECK